MGQDLTAANIQWTHVMKYFESHWMGLKDRKKDDDPEVPKITKALPIIQWTEALQVTEFQPKRALPNSNPNG